MNMSSKLNFTSFLFSVFWIASAVCAENVLVTTPRQTSSSCSFPKLVQVTIKRDQKDDVTLSLKANKIVMVPHSVLLTSTDDVTNKAKFERVEVPRKNQAYHSVNNEASFVLECSIDKKTKAPFFVFEGIFSVEDHKFKLSSTLGDVTVGPDYIIAEYVMEEIQEPEGSSSYVISENVIDDEPQDTDLPSRKKRGVTNYYIDVLPVIDYSLYIKFLAAHGTQANTLNFIASYMTIIFTSISLRVDTLTLPNVKLHIGVINPFVLTSPTASWFTPNDIDQELLEFEIVMANYMPHLPCYPNIDHAMMFTGYNYNGTLGNGYLGSICKEDGTSVSIVRDHMAFQSELVATQALGLSLGALFDGVNNTCRPVYVMSKYRLVPNPPTTHQFSNCSSNEITDTIRRLEKTTYLYSCLRTKCAVSHSLPMPQQLSVRDPAYPCYVLFGTKSHICLSPSLPTCSSMYCYDPNSGNCVNVIPATTTCCDNGKYCLSGRCVPAPKGLC